MAEIKAVEITGEELARRVRVVLEYSIQETEAMMNAELTKKIVDQVASAWMKKNRDRVAKLVNLEQVAKQLIQAIITKAVFNLAVDQAKKNS